MIRTLSILALFATAAVASTVTIDGPQAEQMFNAMGSDATTYAHSGRGYQLSERTQGNTVCQELVLFSTHTYDFEIESIRYSCKTTL